MAKPLWYVDADTLGLAKVLTRVRPDITFPGDDGVRDRPRWCIAPCIITDTATPDDVWIPKVTRAGLVILTRDRRIQERTAEKNAVMVSGARMFAITSKEQLGNWGLLEIVVTRWRTMEEIVSEEDGPYIYGLTRTTSHKIEL